MRDVSGGVVESLAGPITRPWFIVDVWFGAPLKLSTRGAAEVDGAAYVGGVIVDSGADWETCVISLPNVDGALTDVAMTGAWVGAAVRVAHVAHLDGGYMDPDYVDDQDDYVDPYAFEPLDVFVGVLDAATDIFPRVRLQCVRAGARSIYVPGIRIAPPVANHCTPAGTLITFDGEIYRVEAR